MYVQSLPLRDSLPASPSVNKASRKEEFKQTNQPLLQIGLLYAHRIRGPPCHPSTSHPAGALPLGNANADKRLRLSEFVAVSGGASDTPELTRMHHEIQQRINKTNSTLLSVTSFIRSSSVAPAGLNFLAKTYNFFTYEKTNQTPLFPIQRSAILYTTSALPFPIASMALKSQPIKHLKGKTNRRAK